MEVGRMDKYGTYTSCVMLSCTNHLFKKQAVVLPKVFGIGLDSSSKT